MTTLAESTEIVVRKEQVRIAEPDATAALARVAGEPAVPARARLRFGPGPTCEQLARVLDEALVRAQESGLDPDVLVLSAGQAVAAEDIVRVRRKAHGVADWISSKTSDVTIVLRPKGVVAAESLPPAPAPPAVPQPRDDRPETEAELAVREALYDVIDPDLGVNVVDLGFIRRIRLDDAGVATITMTLTSAACPLTEVMEVQVGHEMSAIDTEFRVEWEWLPTWRPADITDDGREQLRAIGFSAF
ncbi:iron-sulfur cluster assembly protein [Actinomycetospora termitidis]|uniref:50S ribosomal protein L22 n=1 Tax=Actinomycetospora termitidis TaxID=3053470 RepID=A0ABT7MGH9_9PSEU|nr:iron-sulfur cluster assembly protein [Actinomycetospora sp. Odt1-22]MDL5159788.1 iron-sulfur cluster assembly protein [Actinomycetospora sp. Odt1-22]